jgi:RND family efflux transporter MFP subunit
VGALIGAVLEAKRREDRWIGAKVWDTVRGFAANLLGVGHLALKMIMLALVATAVFFWSATGDYRITAPAVLEGTVQRAVTAPQDGYVASAEVRAGDLVEGGQPLATLEDKDLRLEKVQWESEREKYLREYSKALAEHDRPRVRILGAQVEQAEARVALLSKQLERTRITSPFAGVVVTGDLSQSLGAPVSRGDVLFEIAPLDSYRVMLEVDERDISEVRVGQVGGLALAGLPGEALQLRVEKITPVSLAGDGKNSFRVEAALEGSSGSLRPGMKGVAKLLVDERNLLWIWTHRLVYWVRLWWWSWWP